MIENFLNWVRRHRELLRFAALAVLILCALWQLHSSPYIFHPSSVEDVRRWVASYGTLGPLVYIAVYTVRPLLFFPSLFLNLSASILFGPLLGVVYLLLGGLGSAVLCYFLGHSGGGRRLLDRYGGRWGERLTNYLGGSGGFGKMLWLRTVPIFPYDPVSIIAGCCNMRLQLYAAATVLGMLPGAIAYNLLADSLLGGQGLYLSITVVIAAFGIPLAWWALGGEHKKLKE